MGKWNGRCPECYKLGHRSDMLSKYWCSCGCAWEVKGERIEWVKYRCSVVLDKIIKEIAIEENGKTNMVD